MFCSPAGLPTVTERAVDGKRRPRAEGAAATVSCGSLMLPPLTERIAAKGFL
jgi:hypothetical protein